MELRELKYFLAVAKEENVTKAAETLYVTQPNLSRQMQNLERELGKQLFLRGSRKITLTEAGRLLRKRAEEIVELYRKTELELTAPGNEVGGDVVIGGGESYAVRAIAETVCAIRNDYPKIRFHFISGDTLEITEKLDKGLIDFGVLIEPSDLSKYDSLRLPLVDRWGVLMRKDSPLAEKESVTPEDLRGVPLIRSKHSLGKSEISDWFGKNFDEQNVAATYNLIYNASLLVEAGVGYAVGLDKLVDTTESSELCFRPLSPKLESNLDLAWKKHQVFPKCAELFLQYLQKFLTPQNS